MMRVGDKIYLRSDGHDLTGYVTRADPKTPLVADVAIHGGDGILLFGVTDAPIAATAADQLVDGFIFHRS